MFVVVFFVLVFCFLFVALLFYVRDVVLCLCLFVCFCVVCRFFDCVCLFCFVKTKLGLFNKKHKNAPDVLIIMQCWQHRIRCTDYLLGSHFAECVNPIVDRCVEYGVGGLNHCIHNRCA